MLMNVRTKLFVPSLYFWDTFCGRPLVRDFCEVGGSFYGWLFKFDDLNVVGGEYWLEYFKEATTALHQLMAGFEPAPLG